MFRCLAITVIVTITSDVLATLKILPQLWTKCNSLVTLNFVLGYVLCLHILLVYLFTGLKIILKGSKIQL